MLKVNPTQREEMKVFFFLFFSRSPTHLTQENRERWCLPFQNSARPAWVSTWAWDHIISWAGRGGGRGRSYLRLGSPGDLLHTSPLCQVSGAQDGPPALAHLQAGCPWEALTLHNLTLGSCWAPARAPLTLTHSLMDSAHTWCLLIRWGKLTTFPTS